MCVTVICSYLLCMLFVYVSLCVSMCVCHTCFYIYVCVCNSVCVCVPTSRQFIIIDVATINSYDVLTNQMMKVTSSLAALECGQLV